MKFRLLCLIGFSWFSSSHSACETKVYYDGMSQSGLTINSLRLPSAPEMNTNWGSLGGMQAPYIHVSGQFSHVTEWQADLVFTDGPVNMTGADLSFQIRLQGATKEVRASFVDQYGSESPQTSVIVGDNVTTTFRLLPTLLGSSSVDYQRIQKVRVSIPNVGAWLYLHLFMDQVQTNCSTTSPQSSSSALTPNVSAGNFAILAQQDLRIGDRVKIQEGNAGSGSKIEIGADASIAFDVWTGADALLRERSQVGGILYHSGTIQVQNQTNIGGGDIQIGTWLPSIPTFDWLTQPPWQGPDIVLYHGEQREITPGEYGDLHLFPNSKISLSQGKYRFRNVFIETDNEVNLIHGTSGVVFEIQGSFHLGDRSTLRTVGASVSQASILRVAGTGEHRIGVGAIYQGILEAPLGTVHIFSGAIVSGSVIGNNIVIEPDANIIYSQYGRWSSSVSSSNSISSSELPMSSSYELSSSGMQISSSLVISSSSIENTIPVIVKNIRPTLVQGERKVIDQALLSGFDFETPASQLRFVVLKLPTNGVLSIDGRPLTVGDMFFQAEIDQGQLEYVHHKNLSELDEFQFSLNDGTFSVSGVFQIAIQSVPPLLVSILSPLNDSYVKDSPITVRWFVNGLEFQDEEVLVEGANSITRTFTDEYGRQATSSVTVLLKSHCEVEIQRPIDGSTENENPIAVVWSIDGVTQQSETEQILVAGENRIQRNGVDFLGNTCAKQVAVWYKEELPSSSSSDQSSSSYVPVDLTIRYVEKNYSQGDNLVLSGNVIATVALSNGDLPKPVNLIAFEDVNRNRKFDVGDIRLGESMLSPGDFSNDSVLVSLSLSGITRFAGAPITVQVNSDFLVVETNMSNNWGSTELHCERGSGTGKMSFDMKLKWVTSTGAGHVYTTPVVGVIRDTNGDGKTNEKDNPDIVVVVENSYNAGSLMYLDGRTGEVFWQGKPLEISMLGAPVMGDIDQDGMNEIIAVKVISEYVYRIAAYSGKGKLLWETEELPRVNSWSAAHIKIAHLFGDSSVQVVTTAGVFNGVDGTTRWLTQLPGYLYSVDIADWNLDGEPDVIAGYIVFNGNGEILQTLSGGTHVIANLDDDPYPEYYLFGGPSESESYVMAFDTDGKKMWSSPRIYDCFGSPTVGDFDGDGKTEIAIPGKMGMYMVKDGIIKWTSHLWHTTYPATASAFDFNADGIPEIVYTDETMFRVWDGKTGTVLDSLNLQSGTVKENTVFADVDGDNQVDVLIPASSNGKGNIPNGTLYLYSSANHDWPNGFKSWNSFDFHSEDIEPSGKITDEPQRFWLMSNSTRCGALVDRGYCNDVTLSLPKVVSTSCPGPINVSIRVGNGGKYQLPENTEVVLRYRGMNGGSRRISYKFPFRLEVGAYQDVLFEIPDIASDLQNLQFSVNPKGDSDSLRFFPESDFGNNSIDFPIWPCNISPEFTSSPVLDGQEGIEYRYEMAASDADGDVLRFDLIRGPAGMRVEGSTLVWTPNERSSGHHGVQVIAADLHSPAAVQTFTVSIENTIPVSPTASLELFPDPPNRNETFMVRTVWLGEGSYPTSEKLYWDGELVSKVGNLSYSLFLPDNLRHTIRVELVDQYGETGVVTHEIGAGSSSSSGGSSSSQSSQLEVDITTSDGISSSGKLAIQGRVDGTGLLGYEASYRLLTGNKQNAMDWILCNEGSLPISGQVCELDGTGLESGLYEVRLIAYGVDGKSLSDYVQVEIDGEKKLGAFTLAFTDLDMKLPGVGLTVTRTYDSRDKTQGDFGVGWKLGLSRMRVQQSARPGENWKFVYTRSGYFPGRWSIAPTSQHVVSVSIPGGRRQVFDVVPTFTNDYAPISGTIEFKARPGTTGSLSIEGCSLEFFVIGEELYSEDGACSSGDGLMPFDPQKYRLTLPDGTSYVVDKYSGKLELIRDANDNTLTLNENGYNSSIGLGVQFTRDALGRITMITDQTGRSIEYSYDAHGDLVSVVDPLGNETRFSYLQNHYLQDIFDALGSRAVRTEYAQDGRILEQLKSDGTPILYQYDDANNAQIVTDFGGDATSFTYDNRGNVLTKTTTDGTWRYTYDSHGNVLSTVNPDGSSTASTWDAWGNELTSIDALGHTSTRTYMPGTDKLLTETDVLGRVTRYAYDNRGNLTSVTGPGGVVTRSLTYDTQGNVLTESDALGTVTTSIYDAQGRRTSSSDALGRTTITTYDAKGNVLTETDARGRTTTNTYDANGNQLTRTDALGNTTTNTYNALGKLSSTTDALGQVTQTHYDAYGQQAGTTRADGSTTSQAYDSEGRVVASTDAAGRSTAMEYDSEGRLLKTTFADGTSNASEYDNMGRRTATIDALGHRTTYAYDDLGRNTTVTDALGHMTQYEYDDAGRKTAMVDALGHRTEYTYDSFDRLTRTTFSDGSHSDTEYDNNGRKIAAVDPEGRRTEYVYDAVGQLTQVKDALGNVTRYSYDANGNRTSQTDAKGRVTSFEYDELNRMTAKVYPDNARETYSYNDLGQLVTKTLPNGDTENHEYDELGREKKRTYSNSGHTVATSWNVDGTKASVTNYRGTTSYEYDVRGHVTKQTNPDGSMLEWAYDAMGRVLARTTPHGTVGYTYDALGNQTSVVDAVAGTVTQGYDALGRPLSITRPNGISTAFLYDAKGSLTGLAHKKGAADVASFTYTHDLSGMRTGVNESFSGTPIATAWTHDNALRLTVEDKGGNANGWGYDATSNRTSQTVGGNTIGAVFDVRDRITIHGATSFVWDVNGRLTAKGTNSYQWTDNDRLVSTSAVTYTYDAQGLMATRNEGATTEMYLWDVTLPYGQIVEITDGSSNLKTREVWGVSRLAEVDGFGSVRWLLTDGLGNVRLSTDEAGAVVARQDFDAWGNMTASSGESIRFGYRGEWSDPTNGMIYLRARWMDATTGRFVSEDPYAGEVENSMSLHRFLYANSSPVSFNDPTGEMSIGDAMAAIAIVGILPSISVPKWLSYSKKILCNQIKVKRKNIDLNKSESDDAYGHWWVEFLGESYGWWPMAGVGYKETLFGTDGELNGQSSFGGTPTTDPHHGDNDPNVEVYSVELSQMGGCSNKTCKDAVDDFRKFANSYSGKWSWPFGQNCHSFQEAGLKAACLELKEDK